MQKKDNVKTITKVWLQLKIMSKSINYIVFTPSKTQKNVSHCSKTKLSRKRLFHIAANITK